MDEYEIDEYKKRQWYYCVRFTSGRTAGEPFVDGPYDREEALKKYDGAKLAGQKVSTIFTANNHEEAEMTCKKYAQDKGINSGFDFIPMYIKVR